MPWRNPLKKTTNKKEEEQQDPTDDLDRIRIRIRSAYQKLLEHLLHACPDSTFEDLDTFLYDTIHMNEPETTTVPIKAGDYVNAFYDRDGEWYIAKVIKVLSRSRLSIIYEGYHQKEVIENVMVERIPTAAELENTNKVYYEKKINLLNYYPVPPLASVTSPTVAGGLLHIMAGTVGNAHIVEWLLYNDARFDQRNSGGYTPFHCACASGHLDVVVVLLNYGASHVKRTMITKQSGFDLAKYYQHDDIVEYFELQTKQQVHFERSSGSSGYRS
jgi:hypothetical protein